MAWPHTTTPWAALSVSRVVRHQSANKRVGQNHIYVNIFMYLYIYGVYTLFLAGKSLVIRSYTVCIYGSGQPLPTTMHCILGLCLGRTCRFCLSGMFVGCVCRACFSGSVCQTCLPPSKCQQNNALHSEAVSWKALWFGRKLTAAKMERGTKRLMEFSLLGRGKLCEKQKLWCPLVLVVIKKTISQTASVVLQLRLTVLSNTLSQTAFVVLQLRLTVLSNTEVPPSLSSLL